MSYIPITILNPDDITASLPFDLSACITWAGQYNIDATGATTISNISHSFFDISLVKIVVDNSGNFITEFLSKNMVFNTDFSSNLIVSTGSRRTPTSITDLYAKYTIGNYADGKKSYTLQTGTAPDGGNITIYGESGNQRVAVREGCNKKHLYYPEGCNVDKVSAAGGDYYQCNCIGNLAMNTSKSGLHTHCSEFTNYIADPIEAYNVSLTNSAGLQISKYQTGQVDKFGNKILIAASKDNAFSKIKNQYFRTADLEKNINTEYDNTMYGELKDTARFDKFKNKIFIADNIEFSKKVDKKFVDHYYRTKDLEGEENVEYRSVAEDGELKDTELFDKNKNKIFMAASKDTEFSETLDGYFRTADLEKGSKIKYDDSIHGRLNDPTISNIATVSYQNPENLKNNNLKLRTLIYYYYISLSENYNLNNNISSMNSSTTGTIALQDSNVKYNRTYLNTFNILTGIIIISGYIYTNFRNV